MRDLSAPLERWLRRQVDGGRFPGGVARVEERGVLVAEAAAGRLRRSRRAAAVTPATVFDLASLTKPLATTVLLLDAVARRRLDLDARLDRLRPAFRGTPAGGATVADLLGHVAGLPAWWPLYAESRGAGWRDRERVIVRLARLSTAPRTAVAYSDLGFLLLGRIVEEAAGAPLDRLFAERVAGPLGLAATRFVPPVAGRGAIPPTETGDRTERRLVRERGLRWDGFLRGAPAGVVGDVNARTMGGVAGHAGLFGPAAEVARLARIFLPPFDGPVPGELSRQAVRDRTAGLGPGRGLGWQTGRGAAPVRGILGDDSFGHVGFVGTSVWCDPARGRVAVLLTNRVHPSAVGVDFQAIRREFHRIAFGAVSVDGKPAAC